MPLVCTRACGPTVPTSPAPAASEEVAVIDTWPLVGNGLNRHLVMADDMVRCDSIPDVAIKKRDVRESKPAFDRNALGLPSDISFKNGFSHHDPEMDGSGGNLGVTPHFEICAAAQDALDRRCYRYGGFPHTACILPAEAQRGQFAQLRHCGAAWLSQRGQGADLGKNWHNSAASPF